MMNVIKNFMVKPITWGGYLKLYGISFLIGCIATLFMLQIPQVIIGNIISNIKEKKGKKHSNEKES